MFQRLKNTKRPKPSLRAIGFLITVVMLFFYGKTLFYSSDVDLLEVLELRTYDIRIKAKPKEQQDRVVVIAAIDEKSLKEVGRWPWDRRTIARLIEKLDRLGARTIALDVVFAEPEKMVSLNYIKAIKNNKADLRKLLVSGDIDLANTIRRNKKVVLSMLPLNENEIKFYTKRDHENVLRSVKKHAIKIIRSHYSTDKKVTSSKVSALSTNLPILENSALYTGHVGIIPDNDGKLRRAPLLANYENYFVPSADLQAIRAYTNTDNLILHISGNSIDGIEIGKRFIHTDEFGRILINYSGPEQTIPTFSATDILNGHIKAKHFRNKIVLIGPTAKGIGDIRVTPYSPVFPGVEIRANIINNLLSGNYIQKPAWVWMADLVLLLVLGIGLTWLLPRLDLRLIIAVTVTLLVTHISLSFYLFNHYNLWFSLVHPVLLIALLAILAMLFKYFVTESDKRRIKSAFKYYVPATIVDEVTNDIDNLKLGGEKRELTVLFSDIRGFTALSEKLSPEVLVALLNDYLTHMTDIVFKHNGMIDKYIGDAIMAVYGAPVFRPDHANLACKTAIDMVVELKALQQQWQDQGLPVMDIGIGINTGPMIVGNMGSNSKDLKKFNYTVIGDAVNLASRIEHLNKLYGSRILISEFTYNQVKDDIAYTREIDVTRVRGREAEVKIYEILTEELYGKLDWLDDFEQAYQWYREQNPAEAKKIFQRLAKQYGDPVSQYYLEQCN